MVREAGGQVKGALEGKREESRKYGPKIDGWKQTIPTVSPEGWNGRMRDGHCGFSHGMSRTYNDQVILYS